MKSAPSSSITLHLFLLPDDELESPVTHLTRSRLAHCVRQMKRMGYRFDGVARPMRELDCVFGAMVRRRNVSRRSPTTRTWDPNCRLETIGLQLSETNWLMTVPASWAATQLNQSIVQLALEPYRLISIKVGATMVIDALIGFAPLS